MESTQPVTPTKPRKFGKPWFTVGDKPGDRSLAQQLFGLSHLFSRCEDKTVLDAGSAQGCISIELVKAGAAEAHCIEILPEFVAEGRKLREALPVTFTQADLNVWKPEGEYDITIALASIHKVKDPCFLTERLARATRQMMVIRTKPKLDPWVIVDQRSGFKPHDIGATMKACGFRITKVVTGTFDEPIGYWERTA